ncbi:hypothetical protein F5887DRAFT_914714 [Amanita rubescens]|nr:hypothetical protein F5887DRAFT_914714 [Amanita rubescens]
MSGLNRETRDRSRQENEQDAFSRRPSSLSRTGPQGSYLLNAQDMPDVLSFFTQLIPDWVIDPTIHLPTHPRQCVDYAQYAKHVQEYVSGGAITIFINKMKEHWREILREEHQVKLVKEELSVENRQGRSLEQEIDDLRSIIDELKADSTHTSGGGSRKGKRPVRSHSHSPRCDMRHHSRSLSPPVYNNSKCKAEPIRSPPISKKTKARDWYPSDPDDTDAIRDECAEPSSPSSNEDWEYKETIARSISEYTRESKRAKGESFASSSAAITPQVPDYGLDKVRAFRTGTRRPGAGQRPPGDMESFLDDPATFSLDRSYKGTFLSKWGHACLKLDSPWNGDAAPIWITIKPQLCYSPTRFVHQGEFKVVNLAKHFHGCGMTPRLVSSVFRDFTKAYLKHYPSATEPNWASVPTPQPRVTQRTPNQIKREKEKQAKAAKKVATSRKLEDQIEPLTSAGASDALALNKAPSTGIPPDGDVEMTAEVNPNDSRETPINTLHYSPMGPT